MENVLLLILKSRLMSKIRYYYSPFLNEMRQVMDPLADDAVRAVYAADNSQLLRDILSKPERNGDQLPPGMPDEVKTFFKLSGQLPGWADERKMRKGMAFFSVYGGDLMMMLGLLSLPYDYAAAHGAQVLYLSQRLHDNPGKRLAETGQYIMDITARGAFNPSGKAIRSAQKVRLIHAAIRYHVLKNNVWQGQAWGQPINQEDMAGTNLSIALIPIRGLRKLGLHIAHDDMIAYLHLWNVASFIMGVDERLLPDTAKEAYVLEKTITKRQHAPSEAGQGLTKALLSYIQQQTDSRFNMLAPVYMRYLLGDQIADWLHIPAYQIPEKLVTATVKSMNSLRNLHNTFHQSSQNKRSVFASNPKSVVPGYDKKLMMPQNLTS